MKQEMVGWQWHQLNHMKIICISFQTDNHFSTPPLDFYRPDPLPAAQPLQLTVSCFSKIKTGFTFLVPAHPGSLRQKAVKRVLLLSI